MEKRFSYSSHFLLVSELLYAAPASIFMMPGMRAVVINFFLIIAKSQFPLTSESHDSDLQLPMLLTECTAVETSFRNFRDCLYESRDRVTNGTGQ